MTEHETSPLPQPPDSQSAPRQRHGSYWRHILRILSGILLLAAIATLDDCDGCHEVSDSATKPSPAGEANSPATSAAIVPAHGTATIPTTAPANPQAVKPFDMGEPDVVLLITGGMEGRLELCDCEVPSAGLARRSGCVESYRQVFKRTILIDLGDALHMEPGDLRNEYLMRGMAMLHYDLLAVGERELSASPSRLAELLPLCKADVLTGNVGRKDWTKLGMTPTDNCLVDFIEPSVRIQFFGEIGGDSLAFSSPEQIAELKLATAQDLRKDIAQIRRLGGIDEKYTPAIPIILLAHGDEDYADELARTSGADLVIRGHTSRTDKDVRWVIPSAASGPGDKAATQPSGVPVLRIGGIEYVGVVALKLRDGRIDKLEYRAEVLDDRWPADERLRGLFLEYLRAAKAHKISESAPAGQ